MITNKTIEVPEKLDKVVRVVLFTLLILLPFLFMPVRGADLSFAKGSFVSALVFFATLLFLVSRLIDGKILKINKDVVFALLGLGAVTTISIIQSPVLRDSLFSDNFIVTSGIVTLSFVLLAFLVGFLLRKPNIQSKMYFIFGGVVVLFQIFHVIRIVTGGAFMSQYFTSLSSTLLGSWTDFSILSAVVALMAFVTLDYASLGKVGKYIVATVGVVSLFFTLLGKESSIWIAFGIASMFFFVVRMIDISKKGIKTIPYISLSMVIASSIFLVASSPINSFIENRIGIKESEIRPSFISTVHVLKKEFSSSPVFGSGVGRFDIAWQENRPSEVVSDLNFWNTRFQAGSSYVTTFVVMTGILGLVAMIAFYYFIFRACKKSITRIFSGTSGESSYRIWQNLVLVVFSLTLLLLHVPGTLPMVVIFTLLGFLASDGDAGDESIGNWNFMKDTRVVFAVLFSGIALCIVGVFLIYATSARAISEVSTVRANNALVNGDTASAEKYLSFAISSSPTDKTYKLLSMVGVQGLSILLNNESISSDVMSAEAKRIYGIIENSTLSAINYDRANSDNWIFSGRLYTTLMNLSIEKAGDNAVYSFDQARLVEPNNPAIDLYRADLYIANKDYEMAKQVVRSSLVEKPNFISAYMYLIGIEEIKNNTEGAIDIAREMVIAIPSSSEAYVKLGSLLYEANYTVDALSAFKQAFTLSPSSLTIAYDIALISLKVGDKETAQNIYNQLINILPNDQAVMSLGEALEDGKVPSLDTENNTEEEILQDAVKEEAN